MEDAYIDQDYETDDKFLKLRIKELVTRGRKFYTSDYICYTFIHKILKPFLDVLINSAATKEELIYFETKLRETIYSSILVRHDELKENLKKEETKNA